MTNAELVALLREARESHCPSWRFRCGICSRIDAALAAHDAVPLGEETVETEWENDEERRFVTNIEGARCIVFMHHGQGCWDVLRSGDEDTLDEAKSAAIAAARGMR